MKRKQLPFKTPAHVKCNGARFSRTFFRRLSMTMTWSGWSFIQSMCDNVPWIHNVTNLTVGRQSVNGLYFHVVFWRCTFTRLSFVRNVYLWHVMRWHSRTCTYFSSSASGGSSSSSVSLEREKCPVSPTEKEKQDVAKEGVLNCKITEIDGKVIIGILLLFLMGLHEKIRGCNCRWNVWSSLNRLIIPHARYINNLT